MQSAPFFRRAIAGIIDYIIILIPLLLWIVGVLSDVGNRYHVEHWYQKYLWEPWLPWAWLISIFLYYFLCEAKWSATLGKRILRLSVIKVDGSKCGWRASLIRNTVRWFDGLIFWIVGAVLIMTTNKHQRLGDLLANTIVVRKSDRQSAKPSLLK